ncbi:MAG: dockerin type I domain-containing protein [Planctomycetota bacterium]
MFGRKNRPVDRTSRSNRSRLRKVVFEQLQARELFSASPWHNAALPEDVNNDAVVSPLDPLAIINRINTAGSSNPIQSNGEGEVSEYPDVNNDGVISPLDALTVVDVINANMPFVPPPLVSGEDDSGFNMLEEMNQLTSDEVKILLQRASMATPSQDAIIAIVDRSGQILGVRVEKDVQDNFAGRPQDLVFAIDGAVAKARTAAFFSNTEAPLTSRTIRFISQSTMTQRVVESNPNITDINSPLRGPGFVAPIGVGGHFPPEVRNTPLVDLLQIEHQSRDSSIHPGPDGIKGFGGNDITLSRRFNVNPAFVSNKAQEYMKLFPESYGFQSGMFTTAQSRGIATLPGGIPLYRQIDLDPGPGVKPAAVLVGGVGVFFPGKDGYASFEQGFQHESTRGSLGPQKEIDRLNAPKVLEAEFIAYFTAGGTTLGPNNRPITPAVNGGAPIVPGINGVSGRIDLVGITLEIFGPHPTASNPVIGADRLIQEGKKLGSGLGSDSGTDMEVKPGVLYQAGTAVPEGWLVLPHDSMDGKIKAADVEKVIKDGIAQAEITRAAIRLNSDFRPGARTKMVLAVSDSQGEVLGLYRMKDATVFSIDVAVAKSRNTGYYASNRLVAADAVDANNDSIADVPRNTAFTNRTFRFLAAPRFPTGAESDAPPGDFSMLNMPGINPRTGENIGNVALPASIYADPAKASVVSFDAFNASRSFRDPLNLANQNGIVFFPGSSPLYKNSSVLVGGFGVSGDGVDQDDVVTSVGEISLTAPVSKRADQHYVANVRLPYQKFNRNPLA